MKLKIPHPYTLIFFLIIFIAILNYILPAGKFDRYKDKDGRNLVKAGSYHTVKLPVLIFYWLIAVIFLIVGLSVCNV